MKKFIAFSGFIFLISLFFAKPALADYYFNPHFILLDEEMTDVNALSLAQIQQFLQDKGSSLANSFFTDYKGEIKKASTIIWQAAQESQISPKVILTTLQKEQSLIGDPFPSQNQLDKAMGYRCPDSGSCHPNALGFGKQVDGAAWQFRQYFNNPGNWNYQAGKEYEVDGFLISPVNKATASLYNYTPHYSGNNRFWQIWQKFWGKNYPDGSLIKAQGDKGVWLIQYGVRRLITSYSTLLSRFNPKKILTITKTDLEKYEIGPSIKFSNYSILRAPDGKAYLVVDDQIRYISSPEVFRIIGYNWDEVMDVADEDLQAYQKGLDITVNSIYPTGALLQDKATGGVYYIENGVKMPVVSREIMKSNFSGKVLTAISADELDRYVSGDPVKFKDGELIRSNQDSKVYVVSNAQRHWLKTEDVFAKYGYKWDNIITTTPQAVEIHPLGDDIE